MYSFTRIFRIVVFVLIPLIPVQVFAANEPVIKTVCASAFGFQNLDQLKADLLTSAKRDAVNELFGELIAASTTVDNFVVTGDQIRTSSIGFVRIDGNASFYNGDNLAEVCITIRAYATDEDREQFQPIKLDKRHCVTDAKLTTSELTAFAKQEVIVQALIDYDGNLANQDRSKLIPLLQRVKYLESGFVSDTETYCVRVTGEVIPIEVLALLEAGQSSTETNNPANVSGSVDTTATSENNKAKDRPKEVVASKIECAETIELSQTMECQIESAGQKNVHQFAAEADDVIVVTLVNTKGDQFQPAFEIHDASGEVVEDDDSKCSTFDWNIAQDVCKLSDSGTYSILVYSNQSREVGKYSLRVQRLNAPVGATPLEYGQEIDGSIDAVAEYKYYTFTGRAADATLVTLVNTRGDQFQPGFEVYDVSGRIVDDYGDLCRAVDWSITQYVCRLPTDGTYSILVYSNQSKETGKYQLRLQRLNIPAGATPLEFDHEVEGSIDAVAEYKYYTFAGEAEQVITVSVVNTKGDQFQPGFEMYDPSGQIVDDYGELCTAFDWNNAQATCRLDVTGTFSILVYSNQNRESGKYTLKISNK